MIIHIVAEATSITALNSAAIKTAIETAGLSVLTMEVNNAGLTISKVV